MAFKDIKGQNKTIERIKGHLEFSAFAGAYLFSGPEGVGKQLVAKTFAKAINCLKQKDDSCDRCPACLKIDKSQHPDVHYIGPVDSEVIKIEHIRDLKKNINLKSYEAKKKVFIINDAHKLTAEAQNALLKILEEPPPDSLIILISAKPALLFKTIISRCQVFKFYPLTRSELEDILKKDYALDNNLAHFLAYFSEGRAGCALRLKDTDIFREKNKIIDAFTFSHKPVLTESLLQNREDLRRCLNTLVTWFRDIYLIKIGVPHSELINLDRRYELLKVMSRYSCLDLDEIMDSISNTLMYLEQNINVKLLLSNLRSKLWKERF
jgi:DNA polymerase-3 subunit delta'